MNGSYPVIAPVVEGHGEERALQGLLHRLVPHLHEGAYADIQQPYRLPRDRMLRPDHLAQALTVVTARRPSPTAVLVLLDADDDCAVELSARVRDLARESHGHVPLTAIVAVREFEAWFLAGASGLAGHMGLPHDLVPPPDPEAVRGAKEWLSDRMPPGITYRPPAHQPSFAQRFDLEAARAGAPSFDKFCREVARLLG
ncbi:hypothetical protein RVR_6363 [Actinacidiphila reveromycinica]|uniref:DUF4276 family protein n=1 Tax=Actinacidiphila reveromycinica TaxID=659352 RepID=A0A7U3VQH0_9ACTN|nr:DUF4276 family protein [Streptomyces sp. SN-593]BBA99649.1 hypothetical protein RVR_6363 [Streptomyces sp. SN-593]